ncbi:MAG: HDIG domain-containing protein [Phycisphaerae bacterium]|nr:HDIG domain-containing protein [Phycisphaerae bacterium]
MDTLFNLLLWLIFVTLCITVMSIRLLAERLFLQIVPLAVIVVLISLAIAIYIYHYQRRILKNHARAAALTGLFLILLAVTRIGTITGQQQTLWATATAITAAIILTIAYDQRFAIGMTVFYCILACFAAKPSTEAETSFVLFLTMVSGAITCCFSLREIRTRMKLLEVSALTAVIVFLVSFSLNFYRVQTNRSIVVNNAAWHALSALLVGILIQGLLPVIEKIFRIATSMTLLDYSDANQPLLRRLAMEAPGTFSHSLLIGSIAEAAAESIGRNGLLCRVGAYYHDIGKLNKPHYFTENEMGSQSRHKELSPAMSQLIIVGHVKDGIEMAKEYGLPAVLRQFIETHHGKTLVEYFYHEAKKKQGDKQAPPSEAEFRYTGPKPQTKEAAIVMLADCSEGAVRSLPEITPIKIEVVVHNMAMKRLQDGQFDECDITLRELSLIETSIAKSLAAHHHGRIAYPHRPDMPLPKRDTEHQNTADQGDQQ